MLTPARELLISAMCAGGPGKRINFTAGSGGSNQSICKIAHYFADAWGNFTLTGTAASGSADWLIGTAVHAAPTPLLHDHFWVAYVCQWTGSQWKCGCRDAACTTSYWQLQQVKYPVGGTTGGISGATACEGAVSVMNCGAKETVQPTIATRSRPRSRRIRRCSCPPGRPS
jgi:hypothetical protein